MNGEWYCKCCNLMVVRAAHVDNTAEVRSMKMSTAVVFHRYSMQCVGAQDGSIVVSVFSNAKNPPHFDSADRDLVLCGGYECDVEIGRRVAGRSGKVVFSVRHLYMLQEDSVMGIDGKRVRMSSPAINSQLNFQLESALAMVVRADGLFVRPAAGSVEWVGVHFCSEARRLVTKLQQPPSAMVHMADNAFCKDMEPSMTAVMPLTEVLDALSAICRAIGTRNAYRFLAAAEVEAFMASGRSPPAAVAAL